MSDREPPLLPPRKRDWKKGTPQIGAFVRTRTGGVMQFANPTATDDDVNLIVCLIHGAEKMPEELRAAIKKYLEEKP